MNRDLADLITAQLKYSEVCHLGLLSPRTMHLKNLLRNAQAKGRNHLHGLSSLWRDYQLASGKRIRPIALTACPLAAQTPVLGSIEAPYANVQTAVHIAGATYGAGLAAYGPVGTPLVLGGSALGGGGTVQFIPYVNGAPGLPVQATPSMWTSTMIFVPVPSGATSGLVKVTVNGKQSNGLPFIVTPGVYSGSCPAYPSNSQLQIVTSGLDDGMVGEAYNPALQATGGTQAYTWSNPDNTLPSGLTLNPSTGVISGTPTQAAGTVNVTVQVADSSSPAQTTTSVLPLTVTGSGSPSVIYSYSIPSGGYDPVGNIVAYTDSVTGTWSMAGGYDSLNRLTAASAGAGPYDGLQANWSYDSFGNRTGEQFGGNLQSDAIAPIPPFTSFTYTATNQIQSVNNGQEPAPTYDASGDVTQDLENQYLYDAEGRVCASLDRTNGHMTGYLYNADGNRVAKGTITSWSCDTTPNANGQPTNGLTLTASYILSPSGQQLTEMTWSGGTAQWSHTNVWAGGAGLIATYSADPDPSQGVAALLDFQFGDWLGTRRVLADYTGNVEETCDSLLYGNGETCAPTPTEHLYTQHERDAETNNDYFGARYYASSMGRFISPDDGSDQDPQDPQSWNLYAYVRDNPLINVDPDGHGCDTVTYSTISNGKKTTETWATPDASCPGSALFGLLWDSFSNPINSAVHTVSQAAHQVINYATEPRDPGCMATMAGGGAAAGGFAGGTLGALGGGTAGTLVEPGGGTFVGGVAGEAGGTGAGTWVGFQAGTIAGFFACASGSGSSGSGGTGGGGRLSPKAKSKLGNLANRAGEKVRDVIRSRGGSGANVQRVGQWADRTLGEAAEAAANGDPNAETAIKVAKQAGRLGQQY